MREFTQISWDAGTEAEYRELVRLALQEDLGRQGDLTSQALVPPEQSGEAVIVARQPGILAGLQGIPVLLAALDSWLAGSGGEPSGSSRGGFGGAQLRWTALAEDGQPVRIGQTVGRIEGPARAILACERILLNLLGRLSGIATLTGQYVEAVAGTGVAIYDTRKTTPGWRLLEKYAVRCGGGRNHRTGLFDAILIKDNHLALCQNLFGPAQTVQIARSYLQRIGQPDLLVEIEVDRLDQLDEVLRAGPDLVLLDNMTVAELRQAVQRRNVLNPQVHLEASGGVRLETVREIAQTGVDRISVGALTHSAASLDLSLDWLA